MTEPHLPSEGERRTFVAKLAQFRNTLPSAEQRMLDALVSAAVTGGTREALARYWAGPRLDPAAFAAPEEPRSGHPTAHPYSGSGN
jgi:hypothetical protein